MGCNDDGDLTEEAIRKSSYSTDVFVRNVCHIYIYVYSHCLVI